MVGSFELVSLVWPNETVRSFEVVETVRSF